MTEYSKQNVVATICGVPIPSFDTSEISIKGDAFRFAVKADSNSLLLLAESLGNMVDYKVEYLGKDCEGLKVTLTKIFNESGSGVLQIDEVSLQDEGSAVIFTISPPQIFE